MTNHTTLKNSTMKKRGTLLVRIALLLSMAATLATIALTQNSFADATDGNKGRPVEANLYQHLKKAFVNPNDDPDLPRVLLIGDSISIGYTVPVRNYLQGKANVHRPAVNCQHTAYGLQHLKSWLGKEKWDVIHFNWGIWDTHHLDKKTGQLITASTRTDSRDDIRIRHTLDEYRENLTKLVKILKTTNARLVWASSTPIMSRTGERFKDIEKYNKVAKSVMKEQGVEIDDLYDFTLPQAQKWQLPDQCHFNPIGNEKLGKKVGDAILNALNSTAMPSEIYHWQMMQNGQTAQSGEVQAGANGVLTIPKGKNIHDANRAANHSLKKKD